MDFEKVFEEDPQGMIGYAKLIDVTTDVTLDIEGKLEITGL